MKTLEEAFATARDGQPFSNGTEGYAWMDQWCDRCIHDKGARDGSDETGCPLLLVSLDGQTPAEWLRQDTSGGTPLGDKYHCVEFRSETDPGPGYEPPPDPPLPGQDALFAVAPHTRMYADVAASARAQVVAS